MWAVRLPITLLVERICSVAWWPWTSYEEAFIEAIQKGLESHALRFLEHKLDTRKLNLFEKEYEVNLQELVFHGYREKKVLSRELLVKMQTHLGGKQTNTLLHRCAKVGDLDCCMSLVDAGAAVHERDENGATAVEIAENYRQTHVEAFLASVDTFFSTHGGSGSAYQVAMSDKSKVIGLSWYTMSLPGSAGILGAKHSILKVELQSGDSYILEKAFRPRIDGQNPEQFKHGVHVSKWTEIEWRTNLHLVHQLKLHQLQQKTLTMKELRDVAVGDEDYDVSKANCHHAVLAAYNLCAKKEHKVASIPNAWLVGIAQALSRNNVNVAKLGVVSGSNALEVKSASDSAVQKIGQFPITCNSTFAGNPFRINTAQLSYWIYNPARQGAVVLTNRLSGQIQVYIEETGLRLTLQPEETGSIEVQGTVSARINYFGVLGLTSLRTRLTRQKLSSGKAYIIKHAKGEELGKPWVYRLACRFRYCDKIQCEERDPLPANAQVKKLYLKENGSLIQYAIVTIDDRMYVTFRGTADLTDGLIDMGFLTINAFDGLQVHSAMWAVLEKILDNVMEEIKNAEGVFGHRRKEVILCGHSLGGGYAILTALYMIKHWRTPAAVVTFGAPQVVVPHDNWILRKLNDITQLVVNSYDVVPRLPSSPDWINKVVSSLTAIDYGVLRFGLNFEDSVRKKIDQQRKFMAQYGSVGTLQFVGKEFRCAMEIKSALPNLENARVLEHLPNKTGSFLVEQHSMMHYEKLAKAIVRPSRVEL